MTTLGSRTSKKRVTVGIVVAIVVLAGLILQVSGTSLIYGRPSKDKDIALAVAKAVYSNNAGAFQRLFKDNPYKGGFVYQVSKQVQSYGPVKEVVPAPDGGYPSGMSNWKVLTERGSYTIRVNVQGGYLLGCNVQLPTGGFGTGSM